MSHSSSTVHVFGSVTDASEGSSVVNTTVLTVSQVLNGFIKGSPTADATYTLPTGAEIGTALATANVAGISMPVQIKNLSNYTITVAAGNAGSTVSGTATVAPGANAKFLLYATAADNYVLLRL